MVSSKCFQVESPSPFKFFAALMPPCAQTECERFTGTIENRSTGTPDSATRIAAISPARPPPTIIIFGFLIRGVSLGISPQRKPAVMQAKSYSDTGNRQSYADSGGEIASGPLRPYTHRDAPLAGEIPKAVAEMEGGRRDSDDVES